MTSSNPLQRGGARGALLTVALALLALGASVPAPPPPTSPAPPVSPAELEVGEHERLLVVAPHPDDETLGAAGLVEQVLARGGSVSFVWVTAGDGYVEAVEHATHELRPRAAEFVAYGEQRIREAHDAARILADGSPPERRSTRDLGFPDGGLRALLRDHWARSSPERSATTHSDRPPYPEAIDATLARYDGADLRRELVRIITEVDPTVIAFPDPADDHPDHHATGLFTLLALDDWTDALHRHGKSFPRVLAYLVHWPGWPPGWDAPPGPADASRTLRLPAGLPDRGLERVVLPLTAEEVERKRRALAAHVSQLAEIPSLLNSFVRAEEAYTVFTASILEHLTSSIERSLADFERGRARSRN